MARWCANLNFFIIFLGMILFKTQVPTEFNQISLSCISIEGVFSKGEWYTETRTQTHTTHVYYFFKTTFNASFIRGRLLFFQNHFQCVFYSRAFYIRRNTVIQTRIKPKNKNKCKYKIRSYKHLKKCKTCTYIKSYFWLHKKS